jgi:mannose-6-phosphate isomerase-like protein (cupin superfamily)
MDKFTSDILKQLLPVEKDLATPETHKTARPAGLSDHWTPPILQERAAYLREMARHGDGSAGETLKQYPRHSSQLSVRIRSGVAELHENFADIFYVLEGQAALLTGGAIATPQRVAPGELRGDAVEGGTRLELRAGDVAHVPAGVPHQMLLDSDKSVTCLVFKVQEVE